jgi:hypothetical protein
VAAGGEREGDVGIGQQLKLEDERPRIGTPLQDPYNKPLRPIPKTYFAIAIFEAAARALCRTS